jgi:hypothetical protein
MAGDDASSRDDGDASTGAGGSASVEEVGDALTGEAGCDPLEGEAGGSASAGGQRDGRLGMLAGVLGEEGHIVVEDLIAFLFLLGCSLQICIINQEFGRPAFFCNAVMYWWRTCLYATTTWLTSGVQKTVRHG